MGLKIVTSEISTQGSSLSSAISGVDAGITALQTAISSYGANGELTGAAWEENKNFFQETHGALLTIMANANAALQNVHSDFASQTGNEDLSEDELLEEIATYENMIAMYQNTVSSLVERLNSSLLNSSLGSNDMGWVWNSLAEANENLSENSQWLKAAREKLQELYDINTNTADVFRTVSELQASIKSAIAQVSGAWTTNGFDCSLVKQGWFRELKTKSAYPDAVQQGIVKLDKEGNITYQWDMVEKLMAMDAENVSTAQYRALVQAYESILVSEVSDKTKQGNLEKFLNAAYVTENFIGSDTMYSYDDFHHNEINYLGAPHRITFLSPVFKEMVNNYLNNVVPEEILKGLYAGTLSLDAYDVLKKKLFGAGILSDVLTYGDVAFLTPEGREIAEPITIEEFVGMDQESCLISVYSPDSKSTTKIQQFGYGDGDKNEVNASVTVNNFLESLEKSEYDVLGEEARGQLISEILGRISDKPEMKTVVMAVSLLIALGEAHTENGKIRDAQNALKLTAYTEALGIKGQVQVVDGKMSYQYLNLDKKQLAINLGAYNQRAKTDLETETLSVADLIDKGKLDADNVQKLANFCNGNQNRIQEYGYSLKGTDPTTIFSEADQKAFDEIIEKATEGNGK